MQEKEFKLFKLIDEVGSGLYAGVYDYTVETAMVSNEATGGG